MEEIKTSQQLVSESNGTEIPIPQKPIKQKFDFRQLTNKFESLPKNTKLMIELAAILFLILFILVLLSAIFGKKQTVVIPTPSPTPILGTPVPNIILNASRYATDSGVLKIETDLNGFQSQLNASDVKQTDLNLPTIDYNINFNN